MRVSIGFELQTNEMSVAIESYGDTTEPIPIIYHPNKLIVNQLQINQQPSISLYGDDLSQDNDKKTYNNLIKFLKERYQDIILNNNSNKILINSEINNVFNDAEFLVTYDEPKEVSIQNLLPFMKKKSSDAIKSIIHCISSKGKFVPITNIKMTSKRTKRIKAQTNFPFHSFYRIQDIYDLYGQRNEPSYNQILFTHTNNKPKLEDMSYYIQTTLGVDLNHVWEVMRLLSDTIIETPKIIKYEKKKASTLKIIEDTLDSNYPESKNPINRLSRILYLLFVYSFEKKRRSRKVDPFIIRHHFVELLKLLNKQQFDLMESWLADSYDMLVLSRKLYETPSLITLKNKQLLKDQTFHQTYMQQKRLQIVEDVGTYTIKPDGLNTMILFEFRYWNAILNHNISKKKGTHDFITLKELSK